MASRKFELEIDLKSKDAEKDLKKFNKTLKETNKSTKENKKSNDNAKSGFAGLSSSIGPATKALAGMGAAAIAGVAAYRALDQAIRATAEQARLISNLAAVADTTISRFQAMDLVAKQFGVTGEKLADQVKDFQDKLGDFTANSAGPFADVMRQIGLTSGLTTEQLSEMAGPEALGAVITALRGANLTTSEMKQALEALASDLVLTQGAFENNAQKISDMEKELVGLNAVLSALEIQQLKDYASSVEIIDKQWDTFWGRLQIKYMPAMNGLNRVISDFLKMTNKGEDNVFADADTDAQKVDKLKESINKLNKEFDRLENFNGGGGIDERDAGSADLQRVGAQLTKQEGQLAIIEKRIADKKAEGLAVQNAIDTALKTSNDNLTKQLKVILGDQTQMTANLTAFNAELARTAFVEGKIKGLTDTYSKDDLDKLRVAYGTFYDERIRLTLAEADATKKATKATQDKTAADKAAKDAADRKAAAYDSAHQSLTRELALLNAGNDAERTRITLLHQAQDLGLDPGSAGAEALSSLQAQIDARQKHLDILEKEKDAVKSLAEAMGRWASGSKDAIKQVIAELIRLVAIKAFGGTGSFMGGFLSGFGSGGMNGYASGGNFNAGETFMVGEQGPEIITASAPGSVIPNHKLGGGTGISISPQLVINGGVNNADELSAVLSNFSNEIASQTQHLIKTQLGPRGVFA